MESKPAREYWLTIRALTLSPGSSFLTWTVTSPVRDPIPGGSRDLPALRPGNADAGVGRQAGELRVKKSRAVLPPQRRPILNGSAAMVPMSSALNSALLMEAPVGTARILASSTIRLSPTTNLFFYVLIWAVCIGGGGVVLWSPPRPKRWAPRSTHEIPTRA